MYILASIFLMYLKLEIRVFREFLAFRNKSDDHKIRNLVTFNDL